MQIIFRFINKGALSIESELVQDCINRLEVDGRRIYKTFEKLESFADDALGNMQKITSKMHLKTITRSMHLVNTPLLYRKHNAKYAPGKYTSGLSKG